MGKYVFTFVSHENDTSIAFSSSKYEWMHGNVILIEAGDFEEAMFVFQRGYTADINETLEWGIASEGSPNGFVKYAALTDGITLQFGVRYVT